MGGTYMRHLSKQRGMGQEPKDSLPKPEEASLIKPPQTTQNKVGVAKTRKEVLKNVPDQKII